MGQASGIDDFVTKHSSENEISKSYPIALVIRVFTSNRQSLAIEFYLVF